VQFILCDKRGCGGRRGAEGVLWIIYGAINWYFCTEFIFSSNFFGFLTLVDLLIMDNLHLIVEGLTMILIKLKLTSKI
jgi:hypothetical protein